MFVPLVEDQSSNMSMLHIGKLCSQGSQGSLYLCSQGSLYLPYFRIDSCQPGCMSEGIKA